jgi:LysM repeat protein
MGYWGWRRLIVAFVSVWVVGCSFTARTAPTTTPTDSPVITLIIRTPFEITPSNTPETPTPATGQPTATLEVDSAAAVYRVQPGDTLLGIALKFGVELEVLLQANVGIDPRALQIGQQLRIPNLLNTGQTIAQLITPTPLPLTLVPPTCYEIPSGSVLCLGQVENRLSQSVGRVTVQVRLSLDDETEPLTQTATVEQAIIPPGTSAPYRVVFHAAGADAGDATASLQSADGISLSDQIMPLVAENQIGMQTSGHYIVTGEVVNPYTSHVGSFRIVVTLLDPVGHVTGYRVIQVDEPLPAGSRLPFRISTVSQVSDEPLTYRLYVEARRGE